MLEWMHDPSVIKFMNTDFSSKKLVDCEKFIEKSQECISDLHMAISDDNDEYMGTVSLKNIDEIELCAEFAITIRKKGMGKGYAIWGMREILNLFTGMYQR